jgi:hypothetical protein
MAVLFEEGCEGCPAATRLIGADEIVQCLRPPAGGGELLGQTEQLCIQPRRTSKIEPFDAAALRLLGRESGPVPRDRLLHQR